MRIMTWTAALWLMACASSRPDNGNADLSTADAADQGLACTDNVPPALCVASDPMTEKDLLNQCPGSTVTVIMRASRVPASLWDGVCALPPL